jgi:hypothetical protein
MTDDLREKIELMLMESLLGPPKGKTGFPYGALLTKITALVDAERRRYAVEQLERLKKIALMKPWVMTDSNDKNRLYAFTAGDLDEAIAALRGDNQPNETP